MGSVDDSQLRIISKRFRRADSKEHFLLKYISNCGWSDDAILCIGR